ncbi:hypothetical protein WJX74_008875 [Apatococcus lobatus]|uniref:Uncharacterized protein n=1 Tax=Apatococcus lobatus TaxID=904363 RepID=A0AAW1QCT0_9CHLO
MLQYLSEAETIGKSGTKSSRQKTGFRTMAEEPSVPRGLTMSLDDMIKESGKSSRGGQQGSRGRGRGRGGFQYGQNNSSQQQSGGPARGGRHGGSFRGRGRGPGRGQLRQPQFQQPGLHPQQHSYQAPPEQLRVIVNNDDFFPQQQAQAPRQHDPLAKRRQWQRCEQDEETGDVVVIFKNYEIIRVTPNGDIILDSQGRKSPLLLASMNDALNLLGIRIIEVGEQWSVSEGKALIRFSDNVVLPSKGQATAHRGQTLLAAFRDPDGKAAAAATAASTAAAAAAGLLPNGAAPRQYAAAGSSRQQQGGPYLPMPWNVGMGYQAGLSLPGRGPTMAQPSPAFQRQYSHQQATVMPEAHLVDQDAEPEREPVQARLGKRSGGERGEGGRQPQRQRQAGDPSGSWPERHQRSPTRSLRDAPQLGSTRTGSSHWQDQQDGRSAPASFDDHARARRLSSKGRLH